MLTVTVGTSKQYLFTQDDRWAQVHPAWAFNGGEKQELRDISGSFTDISLIFRSQNLRLPDRIRAGVAYFVAEYQGRQRIDMDCYAFVNLVYGLPVHSCSELVRYWDLRKLWFRPRPGQVVFLLSPSERKFHHAAIYLGKGLYISAWGAGGDLEIAELSDMLRDFKAEKAFIATHKL